MNPALSAVQNAPRGRLATWGLILLVAATYFFSGRLGLLLAIPPGYATAVWPASGIALAAVLLRGYGVLPGVWLGSFAINLPTGLAPADGTSTEELLSAMYLPTLIALGAVTQAALGCALIRRLVGYRNLLEQELDIVPMLMLGGPLACLCSATVGVTSLFLRGLIPPETALFNWWTWWVGDSIGVLIFTPLTLVWSLRPLRQWLRRQLQVTLPLAALFAAAVWLFIFSSGREQLRVQAQFEDWSQAIDNEVRHALARRLDALAALQGLYASSEEVTRAEFEAFAARMLEPRQGLLTLSWNPVVAGSARTAFEQRLSVERGGGYALYQLGADGARMVADPRAEYLPIAYMVPELENGDALGYDVLSDPQRAAAAARARDGGRMVATPALPLVQFSPAQQGVLVYAPVYHNGLPRDTREQRRRGFRGIVVAAFQLPQLIPLARAGTEGSAVQIEIHDLTDGAPTLLYRSIADLGKADFVRSTDVEIGGRRWRLTYSLPEQYLIANRSWDVWVLLAASMLFIGLLGMFLLVVIGREARVAHLVEERTAELQEANRNLAREAARSDRFETEARARADQISATNRELEQFAFVVSHDLQAPLRNIQSFAKLLDKRHGETLSVEGREYLEYLRSSAVEMGRLIEDLLQLSRVNPKRASMERTRAGDALATALANLRSDIEARGARVTHAELPEVFGDAGLLTQLFQNLVANAIKFQRAGVAPEVRVEVELIRGEWRFAVRDNGIGIAEKNIGRLFQIFRRLHTAEEYPGTGIGLALCSKIVALHGGRIWVESKQGEGTTVFFALPLQAAATLSGGVAA